MRGFPSPLTIGEAVRVKKFPGVVATFQGFGHSGYCSVQLPDSATPTTVHLCDVERMPAPARFFSLTSEDR